MALVHSVSAPVIQGPWPDSQLRSYSDELTAIRVEDCNDSVHFFYPEKLHAAAQDFVSGFPGTSMYAVKANPEPAFLLEAWRAGIRAFDVASLREVETLNQLLPDAGLYFMHPVKSRQAIRAAYARGVRAFAFDSQDELDKIRAETGQAADLSLFLRVAVPGDGAAYALKGKFGASGDEAVRLLSEAAKTAARTAMSFHVGSQCLNPDAWREAIGYLAAISEAAGVAPDIIDVGGGFPVSYPGMQAPALDSIFTVIKHAIDSNGFATADLFCEPGRALVADAGATAARIELRKDDMLYLNDGTYGALFDAGTPAWPFAVSLLRPESDLASARLQSYSAFGPTCDSIDQMAGPFQLPVDAREGDWVLFHTLGSYGQTMQTRFNGFYSETLVAVGGN